MPINMVKVMAIKQVRYYGEEKFPGARFSIEESLVRDWLSLGYVRLDTSAATAEKAQTAAPNKMMEAPPNKGADFSDEETEAETGSPQEGE